MLKFKEFQVVIKSFSSFVGNIVNLKEELSFRYQLCAQNFNNGHTSLKLLTYPKNKYIYFSN